MARTVQIMSNMDAKDPLGCGSLTATIIPHMCKNDSFNRKWQREKEGKEWPSEWPDPYLEFAPGRSLAFSTASRLGTVVDAVTGEALTAAKANEA